MGLEEIKTEKESKEPISEAYISAFVEFSALFIGKRSPSSQIEKAKALEVINRTESAMNAYFAKYKNPRLEKQAREMLSAQKSKII